MTITLLKIRDLKFILSLLDFFGLIVYWDINFCGLINAKAIMVLLSHIWKEKMFHAFSKGISPIGNAMARLEFKLTHFKTSV